MRCGTQSFRIERHLTVCSLCAHVVLNRCRKKRLVKAKEEV